jgi:hypothetical protein
MAFRVLIKSQTEIHAKEPVRGKFKDSPQAKFVLLFTFRRAPKA